jgi:hypothetical protein
VAQTAEPTPQLELGFDARQDAPGKPA